MRLDCQSIGVQAYITLPVVWPGFLCKYARQGLICDVCERELDIDDRDRSLKSPKSSLMFPGSSLSFSLR